MWFAGLLSGDYGERYFAELEKVGMAHVKIDLPAHYVNASFHFVRQYVAGVIHKEVIASDERAYMERSLEKILDMNLDVFTSSYIAEEKKVFLSPKVESYLIHMANRFSHGLNIILVLGLVLLGALVIVLIGYDFMHILTAIWKRASQYARRPSDVVARHRADGHGDKAPQGRQVRHKGVHQRCLVAFIRKILIMSLKSGETQAQLFPYRGHCGPRRRLLAGVKGQGLKERAFYNPEHALAAGISRHVALKTLET